MIEVALKGEVTLTNCGVRIVVQVAEDGSSLFEAFGADGKLIAVAAPFLLTRDIWDHTSHG